MVYTWHGYLAEGAETIVVWLFVFECSMPVT